MPDFKLWKMVINTSGEEPFAFCVRHGILGFGWALYTDDTKTKPVVPNSIEECEMLGRDIYDNQRGFVVSIHAFGEMGIGDLIWTRYKGIYYLCRVTGGWVYQATDAHLID